MQTDEPKAVDRSNERHRPFIRNNYTDVAKTVHRSSEIAAPFEAKRSHR